MTPVESRAVNPESEITNRQSENSLNRYRKIILAHWDLINHLCHRRFGASALAEEAALFVINRLEADDWKRVRGFRQKASFSTYLSSITFRLLEDFSRKRFGRVRPPVWVNAMGGIWSLLFQFLCLERLQMTDAVESTAVRRPGENREAIEEAAWTVLERIPHCGHHQGQEVPLDEASIPEHNDACSVEEKFDLAEKESFLRALLGDIFTPDNEENLKDDHERILAHQIHLSPQEVLLLKMCYQDGMQVAEAGRMLGLEKDQVHGRLRRLLARLRAAFVKAGVSDELLVLLE